MKKDEPNLHESRFGFIYLLIHRNYLMNYYNYEKGEF